MGCRAHGESAFRRRHASGIVDCLAYTREAGKAACDQALERYPGLTAIVAGNDLVAIGCYDSLRSHGLRCPEDVSVIGHKDMPFIDAVHPPLTTIRIRLHEMGVQAAQLILRRLEEGAVGVIEVRLKPKSSYARIHRSLYAETPSWWQD